MFNENSTKVSQASDAIGALVTDLSFCMNELASMDSEVLAAAMLSSISAITASSGKELHSIAMLMARGPFRILCEGSSHTSKC